MGHSQIYKPKTVCLLMPPSSPPFTPYIGTWNFSFGQTVWDEKLRCYWERRKEHIVNSQKNKKSPLTLSST
jgi:hypothetical protein